MVESFTHHLLPIIFYPSSFTKQAGQGNSASAKAGYTHDRRILLSLRRPQECSLMLSANFRKLFRSSVMPGFYSLSQTPSTVGAIAFWLAKNVRQKMYADERLCV